MPICVKSEIGPLKRVLLQRPGRELEHLSPNTMGQLLFDDIPYLYGAQREHDCFAQILRDNGAEVVYLEDLTAQVLAGDEELRRRFVEETIRRAGSTAMGYRGDLKRYLLDIQDPLELVLKTMEGVGKFLLKSLKEMFLSSTKTKLAAGLVKGDLGQMKKLLDPSEVGGTPFLGIQKPVIKAHGSSNAKAFKNAIRQAMTCHQNNMVGLIEEYMESYRAAEAAAKAEAAAGEEEAQ